MPLTGRTGSTDCEVPLLKRGTSHRATKTGSETAQVLIVKFSHRPPSQNPDAVSTSLPYGGQTNGGHTPASGPDTIGHAIHTLAEPVLLFKIFPIVSIRLVFAIFYNLTSRGDLPSYSMLSRWSYENCITDFLRARRIFEISNFFTSPKTLLDKSCTKH